MIALPSDDIVHLFFAMSHFLSNKTELIFYAALLLTVWLFVKYFIPFSISLYKSFSDRPIVVDPFVNGVKYAVSYWTERGGRPYQEDRHNEMKGHGADDSSLYGVFDGHGGYKAAQYCKEVLLQTIVKDAEFDRNPAQAIFNSFYK